MANKKLIEHVYAEIRDTADAWAERREPFAPFTYDAVFNPDGPNFWIRLTKFRASSGDFKHAAERFLEHCEQQGFIGDLVPLKITISKTATHYDIEGEELMIGEENSDGTAKLLRTVYSGIYAKAQECETRVNPIIEISRAARGRDSFVIALKKLNHVNRVDFIEFAKRFLEEAEEDGLINDLLPITFSATMTAQSLTLEGKPRLMGESREALIKAYRTKIFDAVNDDPEWDMRSYDLIDRDRNATALKVRLMHNSSRHHKAIVKKLRKLVAGICGPLDPVQASVSINGQIADISLSVATISESKDQLLAMMAHEIVTGFQHAEETYYQDQGKVPPYKITAGNGDGKSWIHIRLNPTARPPTAKHGIIALIGQRLLEYTNEYTSEHIIKPRISVGPGVDSYTLEMHLDKLKEELSPNEFALKIAHGIVKAIEDELKRKGAHNTATFRVSQFNNGVPKIEATLNGRSSLTRAAVERAMKDVVARELPDGNLLQLAGVFGGLGPLQGSKKILLAIKPVEPEYGAIKVHPIPDSYVFDTQLVKLKEELSPNDFALKIAHALAEHMQIELRKAQIGGVPLQVSQFQRKFGEAGAGVPKIVVKVAGWPPYRVASVENIMKEVLQRELPEGNLLGLKYKFGSQSAFDMNFDRIIVAILPV